MDNAQKAIMIGVGIFITLLIIAAVMAIVNLGIGFMNTGTDRRRRSGNRPGRNSHRGRV